ncbi:NLRC3 [Symbiodinium sp. KB8]|nr:NLRC3 [Symbiodinium sp. KB8]
MYNQFDRVRVEYTWKDRIRKETEARLSGPRSGFQMNMAQLSASGGFLHLKHAHNRLETVVEKEIKQSPQQRMSAEGMDPNSMEVLAIKHMARRPPEKSQSQTTWQSVASLFAALTRFDTPMTTTHELGSQTQIWLPHV